MQDERYTLLIADPDSRWSKRLGYLAERAGFRVDYADSMADAQHVLETFGTEFVVLGLSDPDWIHTPNLKNLTAAGPQTRFVALMNEQNESLEQLLRQAGIQDFLPRTMAVHQLAQILGRYGEMRRLEEQNFRYSRLLECRTSFENLIGGSAAMRGLYRLIEQVSRADAPVLITGEEGSEFSDVARSVHQRSDRGVHQLMIVDCREIDPQKLESVVFGLAGRGNHPNGPAPGVSAFGKAGEGTLMLANIEAMRDPLQARLLEFLRTPFFQGETSATAQPVARIFVTSSANLQKCVQDGSFNRELYYRLSILQVRIPPLRDRREDLPMLAEHYLQAINTSNGQKKGRGAISFSSDSLLQLFQYSWPGNLAELSAAVKYAAAQTKTLQIDLEHLPADVLKSAKSQDAGAPKATNTSVPLRQAKRTFEAEYFKSLLGRTGGNMTMASRISKVGRPYLYKKLKEYKIEPDEFRQAG